MIKRYVSLPYVIHPLSAGSVRWARTWRHTRHGVADEVPSREARVADEVPSREAQGR